MGTPSSSSAGQGPPSARARSIRSHMAARLAVPVACVVVLCGLAVGAALGGPVGSFGSGSSQQRALWESAALAGAAIVFAVITGVLVAAYVRRLSHEIKGLTAAAQTLAGEQLPQVVRDLRAAQEPGAATRAVQAADRRRESQLQVTKTAEIATAVTAIFSVEHTAIDAAAAEARLRDGLRQILMSLGRRNQSLLHRQLKIIDNLEQQAASPGELADLFALDHLTTRMRRHAESLAIMSGAAPVRSWSGPVPVIDVIRAAVAEIEDYRRVSVATEAEESVAASAVTDMIHLLAELIENATLFSPSSTRVEVRADRVANGFAIEVEDRGLGIAADQLREINVRLASPPDFDLADADRLGLFVAGRLAARHGVQVELLPSAYRGTRAVVVMPESLITTSRERDTGDSVLRGVARLDVTSPEALTLVGAAARPAPADFAPPPGLRSTAPDDLAHEPGLPRRTSEDNLAERSSIPGPPSLPSRDPAGRREGLPQRDGLSGGDGLPQPEDLPPRVSPPVAGELPQRDALPTRDALPQRDGAQQREALPRRERPAEAGAEPRRLPRRVRPGSPEQLASGTPVRMPGAARPADAPAPEHARNLAASLQSSWQRSREDDKADNDPAAPGGAPDSEEK